MTAIALHGKKKVTLRSAGAALKQKTSIVATSLTLLALCYQGAAQFAAHEVKVAAGHADGARYLEAQIMRSYFGDQAELLRASQLGLGTPSKADISLDCSRDAENERFRLIGSATLDDEHKRMLITAKMMCGHRRGDHVAVAYFETLNSSLPIQGGANDFVTMWQHAMYTARDIPAAQILAIQGWLTEPAILSRFERSGRPGNAKSKLLREAYDYEVEIQRVTYNAPFLGFNGHTVAHNR